MNTDKKLYKLLIVEPGCCSETECTIGDIYTEQDIQHGDTVKVALWTEGGRREYRVGVVKDILTVN